ncbi:UNVERIFIED_CONTAM: glutamyl-tRNA reductase [Acetivibrio alkalicellulosi]
MNIIMAGIDYHTAELDCREKFSFTKSKTREIIKAININSGLSVVLLCTCNRTEIYMTGNKKENTADPVDVLCQYAGADADKYRQYFFIKENREAVKHLMEVASGLHSMIFGEDQIISQVKDAVRVSNEEKVSNPVLNTLFRYGVTCAKKVKSSVSIKSVCPSVAKKAAEILEERIKGKSDFKVLVIGNGEVGRSVCNQLTLYGCSVFMTLRSFKHGETVVPSGCIPIDYNLRQKYFEKVDAVISATLSPHHTISYGMIKECLKLPEFIIDLAVPRDVDPAVSTIEGIKYYNIDTLGRCALKDNTKEIEIISHIIEKEMGKCYDWFVIHKHAHDITSVKDLTIKKVTENLQKDLTEEEKIQKAISKTVDYIMYAIKDDISKETFLKIKQGIELRR